VAAEGGALIDPHESVCRKVLDIFARLVGDRAVRLDGSVIATPAMHAITEALAGEHGLEKANDIGFHMADWNSDAAFIVALHLFPERFTPEEINAGLGLFLVHAPNHIREACRLTGS
jgi:hypothetical protein